MIQKPNIRPEWRENENAVRVYKDRGCCKFVLLVSWLKKKHNSEEIWDLLPLKKRQWYKDRQDKTNMEWLRRMQTEWKWDNAWQEAQEDWEVAYSRSRIQRKTSHSHVNGKKTQRRPSKADRQASRRQTKDTETVKETKKKETNSQAVTKAERVSLNDSYSLFVTSSSVRKGNFQDRQLKIRNVWKVALKVCCAAGEGHKTAVLGDLWPLGGRKSQTQTRTTLIYPWLIKLSITC